MTTTTIAFPGDFLAYAGQAPEPQTDSIRVIGKGTRRHPNRPGRWATAAVTLILSFVFGAALTQLVASPANAAVTGHAHSCQPYTFTARGNATCLPVNRENTAWRFVSGRAYDRDITFIRYCGRIGATQERWGYAYKCVHLDDSGIWELQHRATSLYYDGATCRAFASWERHQTWPRFGRMVRDARHADTYLRVDVGTLDRAEREHAPRDVRAELATFVWTDCNTAGD